MTTGVSFTAALLDADLPVPSDLIAHHGGTPERRFNIYRNNVIVSLIEAISASFPVVRQMVGDEFFTAMARAFVIASPPCSPILLHYGDRFPSFVAQFPPASSLPYLGDLARLEWAQVEAFHAADAAPLRPEQLAALPPDKLGGLTLSAHPAMRILVSPFPIVSLWMAHHGHGALETLALDHPECALVTRPHLAVEVRAIRPDACAFIAALKSGLSLAEASEHAAQAEPDFDLSAAIGLVLSSGAFLQNPQEIQFNDQP